MRLKMGKAKRSWRTAVWLLMVLGLTAGIPAAMAQSGRGTLSGSVKDPTGAIIPGATLDLRETSTGSLYAAKSNGQGLFTFPELPPGTYSLAVTSPGFESYTQNGITVSVGSTAEAQAILKVGAATQTVTVTSNASQLQTDSSDIGTTVPAQLIEDLPLQFNGTVRNPLQFVTLTPGYTGQITNSPTQQTSFKLNGGQEGAVDILVDGSTIVLASPSLQMNYGVSVEAVQEFKVVTNTFDAEFGRTGGGVVNLVTKSGTNSLHGSLYDILRNRVLDANSWINDLQGTPKPIDTQNDFGAIVSGPVYIPKLYNGHNKTFFMFNYEGFRYNTGGNSLNSAPTQAMLNGDFSALLQPITVFGQSFQPAVLYDYTTCTGANQGKTCQPFPDNKITRPPDPVFEASIPYLPQAPASATSPYLNLEQDSLNVTNANMYEVRIDQNLGARQKINGSYDYDWRPTGYVIDGAPLDASSTNQRTHYLRFGYDYVFKANLLNHFNAGFSRRYRQEYSGIGSYGGNWPSKIGLKGVSQVTFPSFSYNYPDGAAMPSDGADQFVDNTYEYDDTVSWQHGRQSFKFGADARLQQFNTNVETNTSGSFNFTTGQTSSPSDPNSGFGYASFYLGAASSGIIALPQIVGWRVKYYAGFVQDDWKVNSKLTANLGFRYEVPTPVTEAQGKESFVDPTLPNPGAGGRPGAYVFLGTGQGRLGTNTWQNTFHDSYGPRLGFAYELRPGTVLRSGYGIYYQNLKVNGYGEGDAQGFFGTYNYPSPVTPQTPAVVLSQITSYPGPTPPFIDPTVMNGQGPEFILSKTARPGTTQTWTLDVEQQLPAKFVLDVAYVGDHGDHVQAGMHDPNQGNPADMARGACLYQDITAQGAGTPCAGQATVGLPYPGFSGTVAQALRPFPQYADAVLDSVTMSMPFGVYTYEALQAQAQKRLSAGLTLLANYTWSKTLTNADSEFPSQSGWVGNGTSGALNTYNLKVEKALSEYDTPQRVVLSYTYQLPFGKGKRFANQGSVVNGIVGDWQFAGNQTYASGTPLAAGSPNWDSGIFACNPYLCGGARPDVVPGQSLNGYHGGGFVYGQSVRLNPAAFAPAPNFTFGDAPKALPIREFASHEEDLSLSKRIPMHSDRLNTLFRVEFFNAFNRPGQFTGFNLQAGTSGFGQASNRQNSPRSLQAQLRF
ncbi:MAG TPA: carboxypeptidase regulatory-like domain-containing protein, partial [Terracidiphilus sp.]